MYMCKRIKTEHTVLMGTFSLFKYLNVCPHWLWNIFLVWNINSSSETGYRSDISSNETILRKIMQAGCFGDWREVNSLNSIIAIYMKYQYQIMAVGLA